MLSVVTDAQGHDELRLDLDAIVREGARRMLAAALEAEVDAYLAAHSAERDEAGRRLVVRNGHARQREVTTAAGAVPVRAPRVDDRRTDLVTGDRIRFRSVILPPWCRKSPKVAEVLPLLYLHGLSSGDFVPALAAFFGSAAGLSAAVITRLVTQWQADHEAFSRLAATSPTATMCTSGPMGALLGAAGAGPAVLSGDRGGARRRHQGAGRRG
jgi:putative transposase